ncbi:MAG: SOS response-associated peptidase family protein [Chitinophagaceae bacterium]
MDEKKAKEYQKFTVNAKGEELYEKKSFKDLIDSQRCIIIVEGFYEWMHVGAGKNLVKYPFYIAPKDEEFFFIAGIWNEWKNFTTKQSSLSSVIITSEANPLMAKIHNSKKRMPLMFHSSQVNNWLSRSLTREEVTSMIRPYDENRIKAHSITKKFNHFQKETTNIPEISDYVDYPELQMLIN